MHFLGHTSLQERIRLLKVHSYDRQNGGFTNYSHKPSSCKAYVPIIGQSTLIYSNKPLWVFKTKGSLIDF